jgi:hypothetical protein
MNNEQYKVIQVVNNYNLKCSRNFENVDFFAGFVKRNETERNGRKRKCQGHETERNKIPVKRKRNGTKFLRNVKNETKKNRITFQISRAFFLSTLDF